MLRTEQVQLIRHKVLVEGHRIRPTAAELGVSRNTVRKYLRESGPCRPQQRLRSRPVWGRIKPRLDELLAQWEPGMTMKQRLSGSLLHRQLVAEGYPVSAGLIREYLRARRRQRQEVARHSTARIEGASAAGGPTAQQPITSNPVADLLARFAAIMRRVQAAQGRVG